MKKLITICLLLAATFLTKAQGSFKMKTYEENGKIGLLDDKGGKITAAKYDKHVYAPDSTYLGTFSATFHEGLCSAYINQKVGFIDKKGKEAVPFEYSSVHEFTVEGMAAVEKEGKWGFVNKKGKQIIPIIYKKVFDFENGQALVILDKRIAFIDVKGAEIGYGNRLYGEYQEGKISIILNDFGRFGFLRGNTILPNFYSVLRPLKGNFFLVADGKVGVIDKYTKEIIPLIYDQLSGFDEKYFYLRKGTKMGIINLEGKIIIPFVYDRLENFSEGLAVVKIGDFITGKYGYIDEKGKEVIPAIYDYADGFNNGSAKVFYKNEKFYIDINGNRLQE
jgi:hypothetical protein